MIPLAAALPLSPAELASLLFSRLRSSERGGRGAAGRASSRVAGGLRADTIGRVHAERASDEPSDESLMLDFLDGRTDAFEVLVRRYREELHQFLVRFLGSPAAADDVFQEAFLQVFQSAHTFDPARRFRPWLFTIAANKARDWHRRHRSRGALSLDAPAGSPDAEVSLVDLLEGRSDAPEAPVERSENAVIVKRIVDEMSEGLREILLLAYFQRFSYGQIAEALGIPLGTVKSRLHAAVADFALRWRAREDAAADDGKPSCASEQPPRARGAE